MKNLQITMTVRNNQILERRKELGFSQFEMAEAIGISHQKLGKFELCIDSPIDGIGNWTKCAIKLCDFLCEDPETIFSEDILAIKKNKIVREMNASCLLEHTKEQMLLESGVDRAKAEIVVNDIIRTLTLSEREVLRDGYGLWDGHSKCINSTAANMRNISMQRVCYIREKALKKLRHPSRANKLKELYNKL